jgi:RNA polymerase sigma-70 factor (ECF subfamily)
MDTDLPSLRKIQAGDEAGLKELMARHREPLFRFILRYLHNEADAAELTGETFFRVYQNANRFRPKAKVSTWMFSIAANLCRDSIRRKKKRRGDLSLHAPIQGSKSLLHEDGLASGEPSPDHAAVSAETLESVRQAIDALPHKLKSPFIFCVLEEHSYDECAEVLQASRKTVETRIYRARQQLRKALAGFLS